MNKLKEKIRRNISLQKYLKLEIKLLTQIGKNYEIIQIFQYYEN